MNLVQSNFMLSNQPYLLEEFPKYLDRGNG